MRRFLFRVRSRFRSLAPLIPLGCCGCFGLRLGAGPVIDTRGGVGADARLVFTIDVPVGEHAELAIAQGGSGGFSQDRTGTHPAAATYVGVDYAMDAGERTGFSLRFGALSAFRANDERELGTVGGLVGAPYTLSRSSSGPLFGSGDKGFGRSGGSWRLGPELDVEYAFGKKIEPHVLITPRVVLEAHTWTSLR